MKSQILRGDLPIFELDRWNFQQVLDLGFPETSQSFKTHCPRDTQWCIVCLGNFWQDFLSCFEYLFFLKSSAYLWLNCILPCIFFSKRLICVKQPPIYITLTWIIKCLLCHFWILWDKYLIVSKNFAFKLEFLHLIWMCQKLAKSKGG